MKIEVISPTYRAILIKIDDIFFYLQNGKKYLAIEKNTVLVDCDFWNFNPDSEFWKEHLPANANIYTGVDLQDRTDAEKAKEYVFEAKIDGSKDPILTIKADYKNRKQVSDEIFNQAYRENLKRLKKPKKCLCRIFCNGERIQSGTF